jgi:branched-chain amino acid transport system substrate-binding protein
VTARPRLLTGLALAVLGALAVAACSASGPANPGAATADSADPIVVGATLSLTGSLSALAPPLEAGYQQEIANVNARGGLTVGGTKRKLRLVVLNNASDPATASQQASALVHQDHAVALLGFATAQIVTTTAVTAEQLHVPFVTSQLPVEAFASGDKTGWQYSWDLFYDEQQQAAVAARALAAVPGDKKVVLFTDNEPASALERPLYAAAFTAAGLDLVGDYTFAVGTRNFSPFIAQAKSRGAQLVAGQLASADGVALWQQLKSHAFRPKAAFLVNASDGGPVWPSLGSLAAGTLSEGYWSPGQASPGQLAAITPTLGRKYAGTPAYATAATAYAVAQVLTDAIAKAASASPGRINTAIAHLDAPTTAGPVKFGLATHTATLPCYIEQWQHGKLLQVQPLARGATLAVPAAGLG